MSYWRTFLISAFSVHVDTHGWRIFSFFISTSFYYRIFKNKFSQKIEKYYYINTVQCIEKISLLFKGYQKYFKHASSPYTVHMWPRQLPLCFPPKLLAWECSFKEKAVKINKLRRELLYQVKGWKVLLYTVRKIAFLYVVFFCNFSAT
jgi:hypothetical protein